MKFSKGIEGLDSDKISFSFSISFKSRIIRGTCASVENIDDILTKRLLQ